MKASKVYSRTMLRDKDGLHRFLCFFCGNVTKWAHNEKHGECGCVITQEFMKMKLSGVDGEKLQKYIEDNTHWYVVFTGKHGETITSNKKEYETLLELKRIRGEDNKKRALEQQEQWRLAQEKAAIENAIWEKKWAAIEEKRLLNSKQILKDASLKELVDGLITIIDNLNEARYDDPAVTDYKTYVTYEELKEYIQSHFEELVQNELERRDYEASLDE